MSLTPGTKVKIVHPDESDLRQGITQNMIGVVLETSPHWVKSYPSVLRVRIPQLSDDCIFFLETTQVEVVQNA